MRRRTRLVIIILLVLTASVIIYALFFIGQTVETSHVALPTAGIDDNNGDDAGAEIVEATVTTENVQAVLSKLNRAENYSTTVTISDYWVEGSSTMELQVWVSGGSVRIRSEVGASERNVLLLDGTLYIWYDSISGVHIMPYDGSSDAWMHSISYEEVLDLPVESILSADYRQYNGVDCIYVEYEPGVENYVNRIYVSVENGLLIGSEAYENDVLIYRMYSQPELGDQDASLFTPPES